MTDHFVKINHLHFYRRDRVIFEDLNINVARGKITAIVGPSGTGKTTVLELIGGQLTPLKGTVEVDGENIHQLSRKELYRVRRKMGMLFQAGALFTHLNVFDNIAFAIREHTMLNEAMIRDLVLMKLEAVGLRTARDLMPSELSGGMERRVALARALALDPQMIMYDEPFTGQDPITMGVLVKLIRLINQTLKMTNIIVSHDVAETASIADYMYVMVEGRIVGEGTPQELRQSNVQFVHQFLNGLPDGPVPFHYPGVDFETDLFGEA